MGNKKDCLSKGKLMKKFLNIIFSKPVTVTFIVSVITNIFIETLSRNSLVNEAGVVSHQLDGVMVKCFLNTKDDFASDVDHFILDDGDLYSAGGTVPYIYAKDKAFTCSFSLTFSQHCLRVKCFKCHGFR